MSVKLPRSSALGTLIVLDEAGSTNDELVAIAADAADFTVIATTSQTSGRGRLGRVWVAPPGRTLAVSVLVRPRLPGGAALELEHFGWLPLIAGLAMTRAVASLVPLRRTSLKWPNDVQVDGRKISGLLAELVPTGDAVVLGAGLNLTFTEDELPVPNATSLALAGVRERGDELVDLALSAYLAALKQLLGEFLAAGADADRSGIRSQLVRVCSTVGQEVRVELPGGNTLVGTAIDLDLSGRLVVRRSADAVEQAVAAGDVTHLRYE